MNCNKELVLRKFVAMLPSGALVLDAGCAAGRDSALLYKEGCRVIGIDLSESLLAIARKRVHRVVFRKMNIRNLSFPTDSFDGVWANAVLLNLARSDVHDALSEFHRILRPGGICFVGVKHGSWEKIVKNSLVDGMDRRKTYFRKREMKQMMRRAGFSIIRAYLCIDKSGHLDVVWVHVFGKKDERVMIPLSALTYVEAVFLIIKL